MLKTFGLIVLHDILYHPRVPECRVNQLRNSGNQRKIGDGDNGEA